MLVKKVDQDLDPDLDSGPWTWTLNLDLDLHPGPALLPISLTSDNKSSARNLDGVSQTDLLE